MSVVQQCALKIDLDYVSCVMAFWRGHSVTCWHYRPSFFFFVWPGGLLFCLLLCFGPALPRIPHYWVRYRLHGDDLPREHLAALCPWHFLCVKALLKCEKGKMWKYWLLQWCISLPSLAMVCVKRLGSPHWSHMKRVCFSYSTVYTMFPVFSLVLDKDVKSEVAMLYPELYKDLLKVANNKHWLLKQKCVLKVMTWDWRLTFSHHRVDRCLSRHF